MARLLTVASDETRGLRKIMVAWNKRRYGG
jgi:hypothetical protein